MVGELLTSKLLEVLREEKGGVYSAGANLTKNPSGRFAFGVKFSCAPQNADSLIQSVQAEIAKIQNGQIDDKDVSKVKEARLIRTEERIKTNNWRTSVVVGNLKGENLLLNLDETRTNAINKADLRRAAQKYLKPENRPRFVLKPENAAAAANGGQTKN